MHELNEAKPAAGRNVPPERPASRRRRLWSPRLAVVAMVAVLASGSLMAGAAGAGTGSGPTFSIGGGLMAATSYSSSYTCDAIHHTLSGSASVVAPYGGDTVSIQAWVYSYTTKQWHHGPVYSGYTTSSLDLSLGPEVDPAGYYAVELIYGWATSTGWRYVSEVEPSYYEFGTSGWSTPQFSTTCRL